MLSALVVASLAACSTTPDRMIQSPNSSSGPTTTTLPGTSIATPLDGRSVALASCCTATIPPHWTSPHPLEEDREGSSDPAGTLAVTWEVMGAARDCPGEPAALVDSLTSPTHPSGDVITALEPLNVAGRHVVAYVTAPSNTALRAYAFVNADAVVGASCVALSGAAYGVASPANLAMILQILASTEPISYPTAP
jgi:hypothetical protein